MRRRVAVIGGGIAGIAAAQRIQELHDVTLFEASSRLGGHAHPIEVQDPELGPLFLDTAFLIFNRRSYPLFVELLEQWGLKDAGREAEMSFLVDEGEEFRCLLNRGWIPRPGRARMYADPAFIGLFAELLKFRRVARRDLKAGQVGGVTVEKYFESRGLSRSFVERIIAPIACAVWSVPRDELLGFEALTFLKFFEHHGYLSGVPESRWLSIQGSSRRYLDAFTRGFNGELRLSSPVDSIARRSGAVEIRSGSGAPETYDHAIIAVHADQALRLLESPSSEERRLLGAWRYRRSPAILHTDPAVLPADPRLWASWNVSAKDGITYWLNCVQGIRSRVDYFVTLSDRKVAPEKVLGRYEFDHPVMDSGATGTHSSLHQLNSGELGFCGSYFGYGFHEDAIRSAFESARALDARFGNELQNRSSPPGQE